MILVRILKAKFLYLYHKFDNNSVSELITDQTPMSLAKSQSSAYSGSQKVESGKTKGSDTVDLTISDSDDDAPLKNVPVSKNCQNSNQTKSVNGMSF